MIIWIITLLVFLTTLLGGFFALKFKDKLHLIVGFSAGAVLAIALIDLIPEAIELVGDSHTSMLITLGAVLFYIVLDRLFLNHSHVHNHNHDENHNHGDVAENINEHKNSEHNQEVHSNEKQGENKIRGFVRASALIVHSFLDGLAVGFSFQVSATAGTAVAIAVLAHNFSDGINTVAAILKGGVNKRIKIWLFLNALAPVVGIIVGSIIIVSESILGIIISIFAGFFVYIALADMIPESFHSHPKKLTTLSTIVGAIFVAVIIGLIGH